MANSTCIQWLKYQHMGSVIWGYAKSSGWGYRYGAKNATKQLVNMTCEDKSLW